MDIGTKIRLNRTMRGLTLKQLGEETGYSVSYLSQVERGVTMPSISSLKKIANGLGMQAAQLLFEEEVHDQPTVGSRSSVSGPPRHLDREPAQVIRANRRKWMKFPDSNIHYELLVPDLQRMTEVVIFTAPPGASSGKEQFFHEGEECGFILEGSLEWVVDGKSYILHAGDSIYLDSSVPHRWSNPGKETARAIWVMTPPSF